MKKQFIVYPLFVLLLLVGTAWAMQSPVTFLQGISNRIITQLERNKSRLKQPGVVVSIVRSTLVPHVDLNQMSASVVGPHYWRSATGAQKSEFKQEFIRMVISTYATAISSYNGDRVLFYPFRGAHPRRTVQVRSVIVRRNGQRIPVSYKLIQNKGRWSVIDFSVENVSIVQSYRAQFANVLSHSRMNGLIQRLKRHNRGNR